MIELQPFGREDFDFLTWSRIGPIGWTTFQSLVPDALFIKKVRKD